MRYHPLFFLNFFNARQLISIACCIFKSKLFRSFFHLFLNFFKQWDWFALKEFYNFIDIFAVIRYRYLMKAWRFTIVHMILQTRTFYLHRFTGTQWKILTNQLEDYMNGCHIGKRPKIFSPITLKTTCHIYARIVFLNRDFNIGIRLIILKGNIVFRLMFFDKCIFQYKGFHFRLCLNNLYIDGTLHHRRYLRRSIRIITHIGPHAIA